MIEPLATKTIPVYIYLHVMEKMELKSGKEFYFMTLFTILRVGDNLFKRKIYGKRNYKSKDISIKLIQLIFFIVIDYEL